MKYLILLIITGLISCYNQSKDPIKTGLEGKPLPTFNVMLSDSITFLNSNQLPAEKPIAVFYFSPVCPYCRAQTEEIIDEMDKVKDLQFLFVTNYPVQALKNFSKEYELEKYSNITIGVDTAHFVSKYFETKSVPYMAIYGKDRKLNNSFLGNIHSSQIKKVAEE
jgi:peroxiredoxin